MKPPSSPDDIDSPLWNMAQLYYYRLSNQLQEKSDAYIDGDLNKWMRALWELAKALRVVKGTEDEINDIIIELEKAKKLLRLKLPSTLKKHFPAIAEEVEAHLYNADYDVSAIIQKYNLVFPTRPEKGIEAVYKRLKLQQEKEDAET